MGYSKMIWSLNKLPPKASNMNNRQKRIQQAEQDYIQHGVKPDPGIYRKQRSKTRRRNERTGKFRWQE